jgi:hypothetical protein
LAGWVGMVAVGSASDVVVAGAAVVVVVVELLEHAAPSRAIVPMAAAVAAFLNPRCRVSTIQPPVQSSGEGQV